MINVYNVYLNTCISVCIHVFPACMCESMPAMSLQGINNLRIMYTCIQCIHAWMYANDAKSMHKYVFTVYMCECMQIMLSQCINMWMYANNANSMYKSLKCNVYNVCLCIYIYCKYT